MDSPENPFARWLDSTMRSRGLTQAELARAVGVADAQVSRWRRGQVVPTVRYLQQIADVIGVQRSTLDRLAGYPVSGSPEAEGDVDLPTEAEIEEYRARFGQLLRDKVPRPMWRAYVQACEALADGLNATLRRTLNEVEPGDQPGNSPDRGIGFRRNG